MPKRSDIHSVLIIGAGPIIIGQACEFNYSGTQACKALREEGYRVVLVNSNPATIMTDPEFADRTYLEPITPECLEKIIAREAEELRRTGAKGKLVLLPTLGGQTALNTAMALQRRGTLERYGIEMIGANAKAIERGEDRQVFKDLMISIGLDVPISGTAHSFEECRQIAERIGRLDTRSFLGRLWEFELFTAEDTITVDGQKITGKRGVTVGKVILAVLILVVGYWITGLLSRVLEPVVVKRLKIEANQANLLRRWFRALLVVCLVLFSLVSVKIPLTVFAFTGGALAIGLGFGMQNLLKNFVSGLIILFERPFHVGDVVDVGGQRGTVTSVGLRASVLQLWDGTETLIPNSTLLENNLTNWTYTDSRVRFAVSVGVGYGSDPRSILFITHDVSLMVEFSDYMAIMYAGEIVEKAPSKEIFTNPIHPYTQGLLSSFPSLTGKKRKLTRIPGSPPDLVNPPKGCKFHPRCTHCTHKGTEVGPVLTEVIPGHWVAAHAGMPLPTGTE